MKSIKLISKIKLNVIDYFGGMKWKSFVKLFV